MKTLFPRPFLLAFALSASMSAFAQSTAPVRTIDIYVEPFYAAGTPPEVRIGLSFEHLLTSDKREDILKARDLIARDPALVSPMSMMVLAIRLYDVGERDEGVFWFYVAKNRFWVLVNSVDAEATNLHSARQAMSAFVDLAGPYFNSYAFCDVQNQQAIARRALEWVEQNPYAVMTNSSVIVPLPGDLQAHVNTALAQLKSGMDKENAQMADSAFMEEFRAQRKANGVDEQFCWK